MKPTTFSEAQAFHSDLIAKHPNGCRLPRLDFDKGLVSGYRKSKDAADRITKTGEAAGLWKRSHDYATALSWIDVLPPAQASSQTAT